MAMIKTLTAVYDGEVLRIDGAVDLEPNMRYIITAEPAPLVDESGIPSKGGISNGSSTEESAWDILESLIGTVEGPEDWASEHDHYLYGTPKRHQKTS